MSDTRFKKGQTPWNKGLIYTQILGDKHPNWKGGKPLCLDCNKKLSEYTCKRCISCHLKSSEAKVHLKEVGFRKGEPSPRKGMVMSQEQKELISRNRSGKYGGDKSSNWRGGITSTDRLQRVRFRQIMQQLVFQRDDYTCQVCHQSGGNLQVDHIKSWKDYPELRFDKDNCRTLCMACHYYVTFKRKLLIGVVWGHNLNKRIAS